MADLRFWLLLGVVLITASSCDKPLYSGERPIAGSVWTYDNPLRFDWEVRDTQKLYDLWLEISHSPELSHQNVYVKVTTSFPNAPDQQQMLSLELLKPDGQPNGNCSSDDCTAYISLGQKLSFPSVGNYSLSLTQHSRRDSMPGIRSIGLEIREHRK